MTSKVFVSGCFDTLHSGHVAFLKTAASFGDLYVGIGQDKTIALLKGKTPVNTEAERLFMVRSLRYVKEAWINRGVGLLDFAEELERLLPDIFIVNEDGHSPDKAALCARLGIAYRVLQRLPEPGLTARSSSALNKSDKLPYRAEICGGWLDQAFVNCLQPGWVICARLTPHPNFAGGGGLAGSTRACLARLNAAGLTNMEPEAYAKLLFRFENGIDEPERPISGAQDALGLCLPGISFQYYDSGYWPRVTQTVADAEVIHWLEAHLSLYPINQRPPEFSPLCGKNLDHAALEVLARASALCKSAIETRSLENFAESVALCRQAQKTLFPAMFPPQALSEIERLEAAGSFRAWKFTGAGGGGWVLLVDARGIPGAIPIKISVDGGVG